MKALNAVLSVVLVITATVAFQFWREMQADRQRIEELRARVGQLDAASARIMVPAVMPPVDPAAQSAIAPAAGSSLPPPSGSPVSAAAVLAFEELAAATRERMESPEGRAQRMQTRRMLIERTNPDIGEAVGLSPEETERLTDLLARQQARMPSTSGSSPQEFSARMEEERRTSEMELRELLGSKYPAFRDYQETRTVWLDRSNLRAVLDAAGAPLTEAQGRALVAAWSVEQRDINQRRRDVLRTGTSAPELLLTNTSERRERMLNAAAPHLSPLQLESYRGMLDRAARQEESTRSMLQSTRDAVAAGISGTN